MCHLPEDAVCSDLFKKELKSRDCVGPTHKLRAKPQNSVAAFGFVSTSSFEMISDLWRSCKNSSKNSVDETDSPS